MVELAAPTAPSPRSIDRIAASIAANQEQITHAVDRIAAGQEQMTREITKLQEIEQYILYKNSGSPPSPIPCGGTEPRAATVAGSNCALLSSQVLKPVRCQSRIDDLLVIERVFDRKRLTSCA